MELRMEKIRLSVLALSLLAIQYSNCTTIYERQNDPTVWGGACQTGKRQSPIDLDERNAKTSRLLVNSLEFVNYDVPMGLIRLTNDGKSIDTNFLDSNFDAHVLYRSRRFNLIQFHMHGGASEHSMNGQFYDGELHMVHQDPTDPNNVLVLGAFLRKVPNVSNTVSTILNEGAKLKAYNSTSDFNVAATTRQLLDNINTNYFFNYLGSLTTPNCAEIVTWIVFKHYLAVNEATLEALKLIEDKNGKKISSSNRDIQPLNRRIVYKTFGRKSYKVHKANPLFGLLV